MSRSWESTSGLCLGCSVSNAARAVDANLANFASVNVPLGVLGSAFLSIADTDTTYPAGRALGLLVDNGGGLNLSVLQGARLTTYLDGVAQETAGGVVPFTLLDIPSQSAQRMLSFVPAQPYDEVRLEFSSVLGALQTVNVYGACIASH